MCRTPDLDGDRMATPGAETTRSVVKGAPMSDHRVPDAATERPRRPDASMDLLNQIMEHPVDPDYAETPPGPRPRLTSPRVGLTLVALVIGAMIAMSAVQTLKQAPAASQERTELIRYIRDGTERQADLQARAATLRTGNDELRREALGRGNTDGRLSRELDDLGGAVGANPVTGPGLVITVDDAVAGGGDKLNRVLDRDLQELVNGLWYAGAEAISINGHRLSSVTAIRSAGDAITVNYTSLNRPYRVEAIGDRRTLQARYVESPGGRLWNQLRQNYRMRYELAERDDISLDPDPGLTLNHAKARP